MFFQLKNKPLPPRRMAGWGLGWNGCAASTKERPERFDEEITPFLFFSFCELIDSCYKIPPMNFRPLVFLAIKIF